MITAEFSGRISVQTYEPHMMLHHFCRVLLHGPDGGSLGSYSAYTDGLGIRRVEWSPGGDVLAVGSYDQVRAAVH
jgi:WD40 repeat protein